MLQLVRAAVHGNPPVLQHVSIIRHVQRGGRELLHQQHRDSFVLQPRDDPEHFFHQDGRQAHRRFVQQHQFRIQHHGAGHGQHLLFAAGQRAGQLVAAFLQAREQVHGAAQVGLHVAFGPAARQARKGAQQQVVGHRQGREHPPSLGRVRQPQPRDAVGFEPVYTLAAQRDLARGGADHARQRPHGGGLAGAVGADQRHHLGLGHLHADTVQHFDFAVARFQILDR